MQDSPIVARQRSQFAVLIVRRRKRSKRRGERTADCTGHLLPELREALHARDGAEGGVSGKNFVAAQAG